MSTTLDIVQHPHDSNSILNWMLWRWEEDPMAPLCIITPEGEAAAVAQRIRVQLSNARGYARREVGRLKREFGIKQQVMGWQVDPEHRYNALLLSPYQSIRHIMREALIQ